MASHTPRNSIYLYLYLVKCPVCSFTHFAALSELDSSLQRRRAYKKCKSIVSVCNKATLDQSTHTPTPDGAPFFVPKYLSPLHRKWKVINMNKYSFYFESYFLFIAFSVRSLRRDNVLDVHLSGLVEMIFEGF